MWKAGRPCIKTDVTKAGWCFNQRFSCLASLGCNCARHHLYCNPNFFPPEMWRTLDGLFEWINVKVSQTLRNKMKVDAFANLQLLPPLIAAVKLRHIHILNGDQCFLCIDTVHISKRVWVPNSQSNIRYLSLEREIILTKTPYCIFLCALAW